MRALKPAFIFLLWISTVLPFSCLYGSDLLENSSLNNDDAANSHKTEGLSNESANQKDSVKPRAKAGVAAEARQRPEPVNPAPHRASDQAPNIQLIHNRPQGINEKSRLSLGFKWPFLSLEKNEPMVIHGSISLLGSAIAPATSTRIYWQPQDTFEAIAAPTPVLVLNGASAGPTLCLTGAVHGDEINGIEIIRRVFFDLNPKEISGVLLGVPIVNQMGFRLTSRYLPDRRDLNRFFPGDPRGSSASRIAYGFFNEVIANCDALVDLHTGSFHRTNIPQLRADVGSDSVMQLVHGFGGMIVLHSEGAAGTLRRAAVDAGIPAVTLEAGEPMRIQESVVKDGVERIRHLMTSLGMYKRPRFWSSAEPIYVNSRWVRSEQGGLLLSTITLGDNVRVGDELGKVVNPINNEVFPLISPHNGRVIGMALNQVVMPGYATYHIGLEATKDSIEQADGVKAVAAATKLGNNNSELPELD